jgi:hypothetical protein
MPSQTLTTDPQTQEQSSWAKRAAARFKRTLEEGHQDERTKRALFQKQAAQLWDQLRAWIEINTAAFNREMDEDIFTLHPGATCDLEVTANTEGQVRELIAIYDPEAGTVACQKPRLLGIPDNVITIEADPDSGNAVFAASDSRYYTPDQLGSTMLESLLYANWED